MNLLMNLFSRETPEERRLKLQMEHAERMKALELGRPAPEVELARCHADEVWAKMSTGRDITCAVFAALGPVAVGGVGVAATAIILNLAAPATHVLLLSVVWLCSALVSVALIASGVLLSGRVRWRDLIPPPANVDRPLAPHEVERLSSAFQK